MIDHVGVLEENIIQHDNTQSGGSIRIKLYTYGPLRTVQRAIINYSQSMYNITSLWYICVAHNTII